LKPPTPKPTLVTRIAYAKGLTCAKLFVLREIANRCGRVRKEAWHRYGSIAGLVRSNYDIRDEDWVHGKELGKTTGLLSTVWRTTLLDVLADINTYYAAATEKAVKAVYKRCKSDKVEARKLSQKLNRKTWKNNAFLRRVMRKFFKHGKTQVDNQIVLDETSYKYFEFNGKSWIELISLTLRKRIAIPLSTRDKITGQIRVILRGDQVGIHYWVEAKKRPCGTRVLALDKGYTEVFTDQNGRRYGNGLGKLLSEISDKRMQRGRRRSKLRALRDKLLLKNPAKAQRILENNLGTKKFTRTNRVHEARVRTIVQTAVSTVVSRAKEIIVEDLSRPIKSKSRGKSWNRKLSAWVSGGIQEGLEQVSQRSGASLVEVNAAYTSQTHSRCGCLGQRKGNVFHCTLCGVVEDADQNAAGSILKRRDDLEIGRYTPYRKVREILERRTNHRRTLSNLHLQDSSCGPAGAINRERIPNNVMRGISKC
jgi:IS605 OrfB family transposase